MTQIDTIQSRLDELAKEFEQRRKEITHSVEKELLAAIEAKKSEIKKLEDEYAKIIGKAPKTAKAGVKRQRLSREEKEAVKSRVLEFLRTKPAGAKMKELVAAGGASPIATRRILSQMTEISSHGARATMVYKLA